MCRAHSKEAYKVKSNTSSYNNIILCIYEHVVYKYEICIFLWKLHLFEEIFSIFVDRARES